MLQVLEIPGPEWASHSENAHLAVFDEIRPAKLDKIDYCLMVVEPVTQKAVAYVQVLHNDEDTVYWQFGGAFRPFRGLMAARAYDALMKYQRGKAKRIYTYVKNTNFGMLKLHLNGGLRIFGIRIVDGEIYVELGRDFD